MNGALCMQRVLLLVAMISFALLCGFTENSFANVPFIRPTHGGEAPFIQIEEFVPGAANVSAEFYAFLEDPPVSLPTTSVLQYVDASDYRPEAIAKHEDPYAGGVTVALGETSNAKVELHAHLVLTPNTIYHFRVVASNSSGAFETPDQTIQTFASSQEELPDGRVYEQVSPVDKSNLDALGNGKGMTMQASPSSVSPSFAFFSFEPFSVAAGTSQFYTEYRSVRTPSPAAWFTQGVQAPIEPIGTGEDRNDVSGFTEDLAKTIVQVEGRFQAGGTILGSPGVTNAYVRDNATGSFQLLAPSVGNVPVLFVDASRDDSRILFETEQQLEPAAAVGKTNLYEWDGSKPEGKRLSLAGVLPAAECEALNEPLGCAPSNGSAAGPGLGNAGGEHQEAIEQGYLQDTISEDGSKVFFTAHPSRRLYVREPFAKPSPATVSVSVDAATFLAATPSGRYVFYAEGEELYRFDTMSETRQVLTSGAEGILGTAGVSEDGTYAYFGASGVLATNKTAAGEEAMPGAPNLYVWHEDPATHTAAITFIARVGGSDWTAIDNGPEGRTSRVSPEGTALLFEAHAALFLYNAKESLSDSNPVCVSCNPSGAVASSPARLGEGESEVGLKGPKWSPHLTRNLSADGDRVFFETAESLLPADINGVADVYEWERGGVGSCPSSSNHCLYLISTGTSHVASFFGDADAKGENVFFFTRQPLMGQDRDLNFDVYDARVGGGIPAQNRRISICEDEGGCRPPVSVAPGFGAPGGSIVLTGAGNPPWSPPPPKCTKNQKLSHGKCVVIKCPKGRGLSDGKCVKVKKKARARARRGRGALARARRRSGR